MGLTAEDAAYDIIAGLFLRDDEGRFPTLDRWWKALPRAARADQELCSHAFRRLIIGAVHQRVFESYHDTDPQLARLIRNIKLGTKSHPAIQQAAHRNGLALMPRGCTSLRLDLPPMPHELLLPELCDSVSDRASLKEMLSAVGRILRNTTHYRRVISVVEAAVLIREVYFSGARWSTTESPDHGLTGEEIDGMITTVLARITTRTLAGYQVRGTLSAEEACAHAAALGEIVRKYYIDGRSREGPGDSLYAVLQKYFPELTRAEYARRHRVVLEYLLKATMRQLRESIQAHME